MPTDKNDAATDWLRFFLIRHLIKDGHINNDTELAKAKALVENLLAIEQPTHADDLELDGLAIAIEDYENAHR